MKVIRILFFVLGIGGIYSCGDFFEENSQNQAYVTSVVDLDELLMGEAYINTKGFSVNSYSYWSHLMSQTRYYFPWIHVLDDDIEEFAEGYFGSSNRWIRMQAASAYGWQQNPFLNNEGNEYAPDEWKNTYKRIAVLNSILFELGELRSREKDQETCNRVEGEASFLRAYYYYWLVNLYAHPYAKATASTEPGVPLKISEAVEDKYFPRASVEAVYGQIRKDLVRSIAAFREVPAPERPIKANYTSACILMSRVCLYMEDYEGAIAYADSAIDRGGYSIRNLNGMVPGDDFTCEESPETVFSQGGYIMGIIHTNDSISSKYNYAVASSYQSSRDLLRCYAKNDLRRNIFFVNTVRSKNVWRCLKFRRDVGRISDYMLFRMPEAFLNKAEALAVLGKDELAKETLNVLREKRFETGKMPSIEQEMNDSGDKDLVSFVRNERRRELCYEGHRWFDLRRYAVNSKYPFSKVIRHPVREWQGSEDGYYIDKGYYELKPYAEDRAAYVFPLPGDEVLFNKGELEQNEIRPERVLITY